MILLINIGIGSYAAQAGVNLGTTSSFAVLAGETITNTGSTTINGDVGLHPGTDFTGQASVTLNGASHIADADAENAKTDLVTAYNDAAGRTPVTTIDSELGGKTLLPGVYKSESGSFEITGELTLDSQGDPNSVFVFQTDSTLKTAADSKVSLINEARFCRVFWQVGSSATLGVGSHFVGHVFAMESITANNEATIQGQLLARNGAVTLDHNTITNGPCADIPVETQMEVVKTGVYEDTNADGMASVGDKIHYTIHVKNTGDTVLTGLVVEDPLLGLDLIVETIPLGESWTYTGSYDIAQTDIDAGMVVNTVRVNEEEVSVETPLEQAPAMEVAKTGVYEDTKADGMASVGDKIHYTIHVKNTGNMVLTDVVVKDPLLGLDLIVETIPIGETWTYTGSYDISQADIDAGMVVNTVRINEKEVTVETPLEQAPAMEVIKTGVYEDTKADGMASVGDKIHYTISVKNTGNLVLTDLIVKDPLLDLDARVEVLLPGESWTHTGSYDISQADIDAGVVVNAVDVKSNELTPDKTEKEETKLAQIPELRVEKSANKKEFKEVGEKITYSYIITNTGNVTIAASFLLTDDKIADIDMSSAPMSLAPRASFTVTAVYEVTKADLEAGFITNLAQATGMFGGKGVTAKSKKTIEAARAEDKTLVKTGEDPSSKMLLLSFILFAIGSFFLLSRYKKNS